MKMVPQKITANQIGAIIAETFKGKKEIVCYLGSNAATPTASIEALTASIKSQNSGLPFINMVHILLQGPIPYVADGLLAVKFDRRLTKGAHFTFPVPWRI